jgi:hypothetical protein
MGMFIQGNHGEQAHYRIQQWKNAYHITLLKVSGEHLGYEVMIDIDTLHENFEPRPDYVSDYYRLYENLKL